MISEVVKIHDKYTLEIKLGLAGQNHNGRNRFNVNTWFFIPDSLDINRYTYSKDRFYRDVKSKIRFITPTYTLKEISSSRNSPLALLRNSLEMLALDSNEEMIEYVEYEIKMTISIIKSALRESTLSLQSSLFHDRNDPQLIANYIELIDKIKTKYRELGKNISKQFTISKVIDTFYFGDEYLCHLIDTHCYKLIRTINSHDKGSYKDSLSALIQLVKDEADYKRAQDYAQLDLKCKSKNRILVARRGTLKKFLESELFLTTAKKEDSFISKQLIYSLAAGISMIFATVIAFSFQQKFGNFTIPFFFSLVISYMLKDRIKDLSRFYFVHKLGDKYFDLKTDISIGNERIGWIKEGFDYIPEEKVPQPIISNRHRSSLVEATNQFRKENIMLYRVQVETRNGVINKSNEYNIPGINNILRINFQSFTHKMDNSDVPLYYLEDNDNVRMIHGEKVYFVNFIIQIEHAKQNEYHRYRVTFNRDGILDVKRI